MNRSAAAAGEGECDLARHIVDPSLSVGHAILRPEGGIMWMNFEAWARERVGVTVEDVVAEYRKEGLLLSDEPNEDNCWEIRDREPPRDVRRLSVVRAQPMATARR